MTMKKRTDLDVSSETPESWTDPQDIAAIVAAQSLLREITEKLLDQGNGMAPSDLVIAFARQAAEIAIMSTSNLQAGANALLALAECERDIAFNLARKK